MVNTSPQHPTPTDSTSDIPPLESGDRLIRPEFERRYNALWTRRARCIRVNLTRNRLSAGN
ncbi:MAG: hypothetical protein V7L11_16785 [Nostoc sp.]|uniref:hypothetical protein n=1 Tax=Nostoc sp. TaxID=1180 RepID=UPI002FF95C90